MNLMKWFRKNNRKIMAVVVVIILFGFIGGAYLQQLSKRGTGTGEVVAYMGDGEKVIRKDMILANQELEILSVLGANRLLRGITLPVMGTYDLRTLILCQTLFPQRQDSPQLDGFIKQTIRTNKYAIDESQINAISAAPTPGHLNWFLLSREAENAGLQFTNDYVGRVLGNIMPQMTGATYSETITQIVNRHGVSEDRILEVFGKFLAVLEYAKISCSNEALTLPQLRFNTALRGQTIDVEFVSVKSSVFTKTADEPSDQKIAEHFEKYKKYYPESLSDENPYGFGYKLPETAALEYIAVKLDDVAKIIELPTPEQAEDYYQRYSDRFKRQVPSDPQDPNSPPIEQIVSYAEVADVIIDQLRQERINQKAAKILSDARKIVEEQFEDLGKDPQRVSGEELQSLAGDYTSTAQKLTEEYDIKVYAGRTGLLTAVDMQLDDTISTLYLTGLGYNPIRVTKVVFAIDELGTSQLGPYDFPKPKMYQNIGPAKDALGKIMTLVRIVETQKAAEPNSIDYTLDKRSFELGQQAENKIYSTKEAVVEDLKKLAVLDITKQKAEELIVSAEKLGWDEALEKFNKLYSLQEKDLLKIEKITGVPRKSEWDLQTAALNDAANPEGRYLTNQSKKHKKVMEDFYNLVAADANTIDKLPVVTESKPNSSFLCIKDIKVRRVELSEYQNVKALQAYQIDAVDSQALMPVHFNPDNILKRMNFKSRTDEKEQPANEPNNTGQEKEV